MLKRVLTALVLTVMPAAHAQEAAWHPYANPRFDVSVEYPAIFSELDPPPDNGDGQSFRTANGDATLLVFGSYNVDHESSAQLMRDRRRAGTIYSYTKATKRWFVLSGKQGEQITYLRCNLGSNDVVGCFDLSYPAEDDRSWSPVVNRMSRSLRVK